MSNRLSLALEITADPAKLKAGLAVSRREILATYADLKNGVAEAGKRLAEAQVEAQALGRALSANGSPTRAMVAEFDKARASVVASKAAVEAKTIALQQQRGLAQANADAIAAAARAEQQSAINAAAAVSEAQRIAHQSRMSNLTLEISAAKAAAVAAQASIAETAAAQRSAHQTRMSELAQEIAAAKAAALADQSRALAARDAALQATSRATAASAAAKNMAVGASLNALNLRGASTIRQEISDINRALETLRANGAAANDIARAALSAKEKVAALSAELKQTGSAAAGASGNITGTTGQLAAMAVAALAVREALQLLKGSVSTGIQFDGLKTQFAFANGGDIRKGAEEMAFAAKLSNQLGLELVGTSKAYAKLQASAKGTVLEGAATRDIFRAVASAGAVMGLSADEQAGALLAISQMMSKGTVQAEELKGQLGERLPGAFQIASKAMGVTTGELQKMLEAGQVMSADFLPKFAAALQASVNGSLPAAEASARAQLQRLENAFTEFKLRIAKSGLLDKLAEQLERLLQHIGAMADSGELERLASQFAQTFGAIIKFLADSAIMASRFADTIGTLGEAIAAVFVGGRALAVFGGSAAGIAAAGASATAAAGGFGLLATAIRLLRSLTVGGLILIGVEKLIEWGAAASEARAQTAALDAKIRALIDTNSENASAAMRDADGVKEFGDAAWEAYQKAIAGARDYAAAKVTQLTMQNKDGKFDQEIGFYRSQSEAYNAYIDTFIAGENLRREQLRLTGLIAQKEGERDKVIAEGVKKTKLENIQEQIAGYEKLVDAIRKAREESVKEAEDAKKNAEEYRNKASDKRQSATDKANQMRESGLSEEERQALNAQRAADAYSQGAYYAAAAAAAQLDGRGKDFEKYTKAAEKFLDRAMQFAEKGTDANLVEDIGKAQARLDESRAGVEDKKAADAEQRAAGLMDLLNQFQKKITELKGDAATISINAEIADAMNKLSAVEGKIAALQDKTITVTVNTVNVGQASTPSTDSSPAVSRAWGGPIPGYSPHSRADNILMWATAGEYMVQQPTMRQPGARAFMDEFNRYGMAALRRWAPGYAFGGSIGGSLINRVSVPSLSARPAAQSELAGMILDFSALGLGKHKVSAPLNTQREILRVFKDAALRFGNR